MTTVLAGPDRLRGRRVQWSLVPLLTAGVLLLVPDLDLVHALVVLFLAMAVASLLIAPRGLVVARTFVVGYLVLQFPVRALFLLTAPKERPPLYAELAPGTGLEPALAQALAQSCAGLAVMLLAYCLVPRKRTEVKTVVGASLRRVPLLWLLGVAVLLLPVEVKGAAAGAVGGSFLLSLPGLAACGAAAAVSYAFVQEPGRHLVPFALCLGYVAARVSLLHSKLGLLGCLLALIIGFAAREREQGRRRPVPWRGAVVLVLAVLGALVVFAVSSGRNRGQDLSGVISQGSEAAVSRSYGVDALVASNEHLKAGAAPLHGSSFLDLATSWIPRGLWPDKPRSFSIRFGEEVFSFSHSAGNEFFAPSYSGEWLLNFGLVGLLVGWAVFGVVLARVDAIGSLGHRMLWLVPAVHMVEGSVVAQLWLALPFVLGGYAVLRATRPDHP
ncbi:MAG: hypothetical protein JWO22_2904 [Frankiales bacterium]|nr:hypothetical protein [Frankiales bacterium]